MSEIDLLRAWRDETRNTPEHRSHAKTISPSRHWNTVDLLLVHADELEAMVERLRAAAPASEDDGLISVARKLRSGWKPGTGRWWEPYGQSCVMDQGEVTAVERAALDLLHGAAAGSPPPTPAPTREQVWEAIAEAPDAPGTSNVLGYLGEPGVDWATDAVMALLSTQPASTVLWEGPTRARPAPTVVPAVESYVDVIVPAPPGTHVVVMPVEVET